MTRAPVVRQISWLAVVPQLVALGSAMAIGWFVAKRSKGMIVGVAFYFAYSIGARMLIARAHRRGMRLVRNEQYEAAIHAYGESYEFFTRNPWIDRFRAITMMSPSAISYREMALCNIAFCYSQIGNGGKAKEYYHRALDEFPNSGLATAALRMIESVEQQPMKPENATSSLGSKLH